MADSIILRCSSVMYSDLFTFGSTVVKFLSTYAFDKLNLVGFHMLSTDVLNKHNILPSVTKKRRNEAENRNRGGLIETYYIGQNLNLHSMLLTCYIVSLVYELYVMKKINGSHAQQHLIYVVVLSNISLLRLESLVDCSWSD